MLKHLISIFILLFIMQANIQAQAEWQALSTSHVTFKIKNAGLNVNGSFDGLETDINFSPEQLSKSKITATVSTKTIDTGINARDTHLRSDDYFSVVKYPKIKMISTKLEKNGSSYIGYFDLTIRDVTKSIKMPFKFTQQDKLATFEGTFSINRRDFNVGGWSMILGNEADLSIVIKAQKK